MTWTPGDDALLAGYGNGDAEAAVAFIRRHQARIYGLALSIVIDPALAEDVSQEAFIRAWRHAATYDPRRGSVGTWLLTITRNLSIDALRLRRSVPVDPTTLVALNIKATGVESEPGRAAAVADQADRLRLAIAELPEDQRRAIVLAGLIGRTAKEVSEQEGIPLGTAKTRIRAAMRKLRLMVAEDAAGYIDIEDRP
jgi:RNA polymerase sigma-70 factor (ECF subfamily)